MKLKLIIHILLYAVGAACFALMFVLKSKAAGFIGLALLFAAFLMTFINAVRRIGEAKREREDGKD